jgi:hypothetical protein
MVVNSSVMGSGTVFLGLLALVFVGLKLTGHVDWSWWWILGPICIGFGILVSLKAD